MRIATREDIDNLKIVSDPQISPGGEMVAFVVSTTEGDHTRSNIWAVSADGGEPRQLTAGRRSDTAPRRSPDGRTLAFLSDRAKETADAYVDEWSIKTLTPQMETQIYLLPTGGGEAVQLTTVNGGVLTPRNLDPFAWSGDGKRIAFLNTDPLTDEEKRRIKVKDDAIEFEKGPKYTRLYVVDVETGDVQCVSPDGLQVWEFDLSPTGEEFVVVSSELPFESSWYKSSRLAAFPSHLVQRGRSTRCEGRWRCPRGLRMASKSPSSRRITAIVAMSTAAYS